MSAICSSFSAFAFRSAIKGILKRLNHNCFLSPAKDLDKQKALGFKQRAPIR